MQSEQPATNTKRSEATRGAGPTRPCRIMFIQAISRPSRKPSNPSKSTEGRTTRATRREEATPTPKSPERRAQNQEPAPTNAATTRREVRPTAPRAPYQGAPSGGWGHDLWGRAGRGAAGPLSLMRRGSRRSSQAGQGPHAQPGREWCRGARPPTLQEVATPISPPEDP